MYRNIPSFVFLLIFIQLISIDSIFSKHYQYPDTFEVKKNIVEKSVKWVIPAVIIGFGIGANHHQGLKDWDYKVQDFALNHSNGRHFKLDDFLAFAPVTASLTLDLSGVKSRNKLADKAGIYFLASALNAIMVYPVKQVTSVSRPDGMDMHSFPSGHTSNAFVGAGFFWYEYKDYSSLLALSGFVTASTTAYLRLYNNKHWFSDVIAGAGFGILATHLSNVIYPEIKKIFPKKQSKQIGVAPIWVGESPGIYLSLQF